MDYHDVLAAFGAGSAHPGGFRGTLDGLEQVTLAPHARVLEVGCGTGRTACAIAERFGVEVIGVDLREEMLTKARQRAAAFVAPVVFLHAERPDQLAFADASFDLVVAESVTIFNPIPPLLAEYWRVLRTGGVLLDTEMAASYPLPPPLLQEVRELYGATIVPTLKEWKQLFTAAGFANVQTVRSGPVREMSLQDELHDGMAMVSKQAFSSAATRIVERNTKLMGANAHWFAYGVFRAIKPT